MRRENVIRTTYAVRAVAVGKWLLLGASAAAAATAYAAESPGAAGARVQMYLQMGEQYAARHYDDEAIRAYRAAAELLRDAPVEQQLAVVERLIRLDDIAGATEHVQRILKTHPGHAEARALLARLKPGTTAPAPAAPPPVPPPSASGRQRLDLFVQMGNDYNAHNMNIEAAQAFRAAARVALDLDIPVGDQLALIEHLASLQDVAGASAALNAVVAKHPDNPQARTLHARYLAWNGQQAAAIREADVVLAADPSNRDAMLVKAHAADWQGDEATALPLYEKLLDEKEDFEIRLAYTDALLATGDNEKAQQNMVQLIPSSEAQNRALNDLEWYLRRKTAQNFQLRQKFYSDNGDTDVNESIASLEFPLRRSSLGVKLGETRTADRDQRITSREFGIDGHARYSDSTTISGGIGSVELDTDRDDSVVASYLEARSRWPHLDTLLGMSRAPDTGSTGALTTPVVTEKVRGVAGYAPARRWTLDGELSFATDSLDGQYTQLMTAARYVLHYGMPNVQTGLRRETRDSRRWGWWGDVYRTERVRNELLLSTWVARNRFYSGAEMFYGEEKYSIFGSDYHSDNTGWYVTTSYQWVEGFFVEAQWEGAIYGVDQDYPFRYWQLNLRAIGYF